MSHPALPNFARGGLLVFVGLVALEHPLRPDLPVPDHFISEHLVKLYRAGEHTISELEELFPVTRSTIYRAITRAGGRAPKSSAEAIEPAAVGSGYGPSR